MGSGVIVGGGVGEFRIAATVAVGVLIGRRVGNGEAVGGSKVGNCVGEGQVVLVAGEISVAGAVALASSATGALVSVGKGPGEGFS